MLEQIIQAKNVREITKYINRAERCVIVAHTSPDGDAVASSLALKHFLTELGKAVTIVLPDDFPHYYRWLQGSTDILIHKKYPAEAEQIIGEASLIFCLDLNDPRRLGSLAGPVVSSSAVRVLIDHHLDPVPDFCRCVISCPAICSTSEMVFRLICRMGMYEIINLPMAECIYTGMMTDTGVFAYNSSHPDVYTIIGELIKKGIDKDKIYRSVYQVSSEGRLRLMGYLLYEKMKIYPKRQTALLTLTNEEKIRFGHQPGDTEGFANLPLEMDGISFSAFLKEEGECIRLSFRSVGDFPANLFAARFGGGGHRNAAGGTFEGTLPEAIKLFEEVLSVTNPSLFV
ncbi:MAG: bifunctional oligoribonuclease/PAP phosphatase NrnA [Tannerellaceae bacterium]|jgi:phosphoesterase RecJ-like protein|nr:bifunctional oligoribonuclease/PAP phosphatase NrnA [Tannerellaceae bacterium]